MNIDIAKRLVDRRRAAGLSQEALAEELGVTRQAVSKWERSESSPDTDNLIALAALYGVSLDDLLYQDVAAQAQPAPAGDVAAPSEDGARAVSHAEGDAAVQEPSAASPEAGSASAEGGAAAGAAADGAREAAAPCAGEGEGDPCAKGPFACASEEGTVSIGPDGIHVVEPDSGDYVHVGWREGVHVRDGRRGDEVHVGWDGVHVNDRHYHGWHEAHADWMARPRKAESRAWRNWDRFPFPVLVVLAYLVAGLMTGEWLATLSLGLAIPVYYALGALLFGHRLCAFAETVYAMAVIGWFFFMCLAGQPHPAWVMLLTIPLVAGLLQALSRWWRTRRA